MDKIYIISSLSIWGFIFMNPLCILIISNRYLFSILYNLKSWTKHLYFRFSEFAFATHIILYLIASSFIFFNPSINALLRQRGSYKLDLSSSLLFLLTTKNEKLIKLLTRLQSICFKLIETLYFFFSLFLSQKMLITNLKFININCFNYIYIFITYSENTFMCFVLKILVISPSF